MGKRKIFELVIINFDVYFWVSYSDLIFKGIVKIEWKLFVKNFMYIKYGWCKLSLLMVVSFFFKFFILLKIKLESIK